MHGATSPVVVVWDLIFSLLKSTVVEVKGRSVGIIGYVTRSTEYNFPLHEVRVKFQNTSLKKF